MVIGKKKRDVKFIIYQSLYILVIAMLGAKHVTINNIPEPPKPGEIIIEIKKLDSLSNIIDSLNKLTVYNKENDTILLKLKDSEKYGILTPKDTTVNKDRIKELVEKISNLENQVKKQPRVNPSKNIQEPGSIIPPQK